MSRQRSSGVRPRAQRTKRISAAVGFASLILACCGITARAQNDIIVSQFMHNIFAVNPAFAGSRDCMSIFGSMRKQWAPIENSPQSALITAHTALRKAKLTMGWQLYHQKIHEVHNAGASVAVGYKTQMGTHSWFSIALQPGVSFRARQWNNVRLMEPDDEIFADNSTALGPLLGVGAAIYSSNWFFGVSTPSLFLTDDFEHEKFAFAGGEATYIATGGYWFDIGLRFALQPTVLADYSKRNGFCADIALSAIINDFVWVQGAYRTNKDVTAGLAFTPGTRIKVAYSYTVGMGPVKSYNSGTHELSFQYDFVFQVKTVGHKFY